MKLGLFGGAFDPPHLGHLAAAQWAAQQVDRLLILPEAASPVKTPVAAGEERLQMARLLFSEFEVLDWELERGAVTYTADTVRALRERCPEAELVLFLGEDKAESFPRWRGADYLRENVTLSVFARGTEVDISSTALRALLRERQGREYLSDPVYSTIIAHRLYDAKPDFSWLREKSYARLKPRRIPHVQGVEREAARLAEHWGEDVEEARTAAILHDITKKEDLTNQLQLCEKYGILPDELERQSSALLHAKTGAMVAREEFGVSPRVEEAIRWHTTGRAGMSKLEKIVYLADMLEPSRSFPGVEELRRLSYEDLDLCLLRACERCAAHVQETGEPLHPNTLACRDELQTIRDKENHEANRQQQPLQA
ncbi:MAG: bis(5'-nucleosyl)-tetraphosphatase (symmetrical) YqeK [bacterium]